MDSEESMGESNALFRYSMRARLACGGGDGGAARGWGATAVDGDDDGEVEEKRRGKGEVGAKTFGARDIPLQLESKTFRHTHPTSPSAPGQRGVRW